MTLRNHDNDKDLRDYIYDLQNNINELHRWSNVVELDYPPHLEKIVDVITKSKKTLDSIMVKFIEASVVTNNQRSN